MRRANPRSRARSWVLQFLYAWEMSDGDSLLEFGERALRQRVVAGRYAPYIRRLLVALDRALPECDARLEESMDNWRMHRLSAIDRNILRIGATEILQFPDVPPQVAIHEAVRLAERYGSAESPRFVNGVLDGVSRRAAAAG